MKIRVFAGLTAFISITNVACVMAEYPQSNTVVNFYEQDTVSDTKSWISSPSENIFTVDGKNFILLDTDSEGNFFVLAEEHYGTYPIETGIENRVLLQTAKKENGETTFTDAGADMTDTDSWRFNPERTTNIAYWLNNDFITKGNTSQYIFPERVYNHILEKDWQIEGFEAARSWTANNYYDSYFGGTNALDYAEKFKGDTYTVSSKLSLLSYTEYLTYKDKIGVAFNNSGGWSGMLLRTSDAMVSSTDSGNNGSINMTRSNLMVRTRNADSSDNSNLIIVYADAISSNNYFVRPCFWLDKDFFKEVPCELEYDKNGNVSIGAEPLKKIKNHTYEELRTIYTDGQLESLGYTVPERDWYNYPSHPDEKADLKAGESGNTGIKGYYTSPKENLFTVDGKSFILLDKDKNGNYFVMTNEEYGQSIFSKSASDNIKEKKESEWYFDPQNSTSIAYWLNNDFILWGNRFKDDTTIWKLPQSIIDNLVESEWEIEPHYPINGWTVNSYGTDSIKKEIEEWREKQIADSEKRTVKCKVALMSFTEYQTYKEKIGLTVLANGYAGFSLRTPRSQANVAGDGKSWSITLGQLQVANHSNGNNLIFSTCGANNDIYYVRPVFYLSRNFFAENALDIELMGENVVNEISKSYDYYDMKDIYSDEQMRGLGINPERKNTSAIPSAKDVVILGKASENNAIEASYIYLPNEELSEANAERNSKLTWYISDTPTGDKTEIAFGASCVIPENTAGKYISFGVTPKNACKISGVESYSEAFEISESNITVKTVEFLNEKSDIVYNVNGVSDLTVKMEYNAENDNILIFAIYDSRGKLLKMTTSTLTADKNEISLTLSQITSGGGSKAKLMIFKADDLTETVFSKTL